jgi:hypothetical protein
MTAPEIDDGLAVHHEGDGRADLLVSVEAGLEDLPDLAEAGVAVAVGRRSHRFLLVQATV